MIHSHQSIYSGGAHVKPSFFYLQHFSSCLRRLNNHVTYVTIICDTKFKPEFQSTKQENVACFINTKGTSIHANEIKLKNLRVNLRIFKVFSTFIKTARWKMPLSMTHRNQVNQFANPSKFR